MKCIVGIALVATLCLYLSVEATPADDVLTQMDVVTKAQQKLTEQLKKLIAGDKITDTSVQEKFKKAGGTMGESDRLLSEAMMSLGEFLGFPKVAEQPPPQ